MVSPKRKDKTENSDGLREGFPLRKYPARNEDLPPPAAADRLPFPLKPSVSVLFKALMEMVLSKDQASNEA